MAVQSATVDPTLEAQVREVYDEALAPFAARLVEHEFLMRDADQWERAHVASLRKFWPKLGD